MFLLVSRLSRPSHSGHLFKCKIGQQFHTTLLLYTITITKNHNTLTREQNRKTRLNNQRLDKYSSKQRMRKGRTKTQKKTPKQGKAPKQPKTTKTQKHLSIVQFWQ